LNKIENKSRELAPIDRKSLFHSRFLNNWAPLILLGSAGLFGWAIRGCSGFGAIPGCVFAGTLYAAVWYGLGKENTRKKTRRYNSGWSILALIFGIGISGAQGWMQWPSWVKGELVLNANVWPNVTTFINPFWGYEWWFIVAVHWGGLGAVFLAWTGSQKTLTWKEWILRIAFTVGGGIIAYLLFIIFPGLFLPPAEGITTSDYLDWVNYPALQRAFSNNLQAITFLGIYLGGLAFEIYHRDWINVKLIVIVGVITGLSWDFFQIWQFVGNWFPTVGFNWLRCWETYAGFRDRTSLWLCFYRVQ
jgi:hypothetical protein